MSKRLAVCSTVLSLFLLSITSSVWAVGTVLPPVSTGPQVLTGFGGGANAYSFFMQPNSDWKGNITGIGAGSLWRVEVLGVDMRGVTGIQGRTIDFVLQNADVDGPNHNFRLSATLFSSSTTDRLTLTSGLAPAFLNDAFSQLLVDGDLTLSTFDLRYEFYKATTSDPWTITPSFRLNLPGFDWQTFSGVPFTTSLGGLDFMSGRLDVVFNQGAGGVLRFDDFRVLPIPEPGSWLLFVTGLLMVAVLKTTHVNAFYTPIGPR